MGVSKPEPRRRKRKRDKMVDGADTASEAIKKMLSKKKVSKKINYDVLEGLGLAETSKGAEVEAVIDTTEDSAGRTLTGPHADEFAPRTRQYDAFEGPNHTNDDLDD